MLLHLSEGDCLYTYDLSVGIPTPYKQYISISGAFGSLKQMSEIMRISYEHVHQSAISRIIVLEALERKEIGLKFSLVIVDMIKKIKEIS